MKHLGRAHPYLMGLSALTLVLLAGIGFEAVRMWRSFAPVNVDYSVPVAPELHATSPDQVVYRIDASRSTVAYDVAEHLAGVDRNAHGTTSGIAGDVLIDNAHPDQSQIGQIVVNVEQFKSDQSLRDNRIRHEFLQSEKYPLAYFTPTSISGLPPTIADATDYHVTVVGDLKVTDATNPVTLDATVRRDGPSLHITATTDVKLSTYGIGPIRIVGLVSTGDDAKLSFDLTAVDARTFAAPTTLPGPKETFATGGPSFAKTVQPILEQSCASCHQPGGSGSQEWQLATAGDAATAGSGISLVTQSRYMPPWPASNVGIALQHPMSLSDDQIAAIKAWADAGSPLDVAPSTPVKAAPPVVTPPRRDAVLRLPQPYQPTPANPNDYRCFVLDPQVTSPTVVTGYEFLPDQVRDVHHALVYRLHAGSRSAADETAAADPDPGWQCYGGINVRGTGLPIGDGGGADLVMGYAPGQFPTQYAPGTGLLLQPGDFFVVQMHYHVTTPSPPDQSAIALQYGQGSPADYKDVKVTTMVAPAEIPCAPDQTGPLCDRNAEIAEIASEFGPIGPAIANGVHALCGTTPEQLGVLDENLLAHSSCTYSVHQDEQLLAVLGHMHEMGKSFRMTLDPGTPNEKVLLDIPNWDFDWQFNYPVEGTVVLHQGDSIKIECSWDRKLAEPGPPHYVTWAEGTEDEMCFSTIATVPTGP